jgi:hypothetical protein
MYSHKTAAQKEGSRAAANQERSNPKGKSYASAQLMKNDEDGKKSNSIWTFMQWTGEKLQQGQQLLYELFDSGNDIYGIAEKTGFGVYAIREMLKDPYPDEEMVNEFMKIVRKNFKYSYHTNPLAGLVPPYLIENLPDDDEAKVNEIFTRIPDIPFLYTGVAGDGATAFLKKSGDCSDLAEMFIYAVKAAGIDDIQMEDMRGNMLVAPGHAKGYDITFNSEGEPWWIFQDHFWCSYKGTHYDLLFGRQGYPQMIMCSGGDKYGEIRYRTFSNGRCMISPEYFARLNVEIVGRPQGMIFVSLDEMINFINARLPDPVIK